MNSNKLMLAGTLALLAVLGTYYAAPAIALSVKAALIRDADNPGLNPFQIEVTSFAGFTVPANQRLVIDYISYGQTDSAGPLQIGTTVNGVEADHTIPHDVSESYNGFRYSGRAVHIYADPGTHVGFGSTSSAGQDVAITVSGHLISVP